jgi:hypothetical protein
MSISFEIEVQYVPLPPEKRAEYFRALDWIWSLLEKPQEVKDEQPKLSDPAAR